ncbi:MAG: SDR family NAD(P)-dependent oxidoreductase [Gammaproteobacteria bacterium]|nr:SDR family NAD(P)-dependent oxidoreductase [Gammaproteobacteria bacterium]MCH9743602.1 SDR family NAD(P)-dependent oxidoreductase [Gammaproteobacteria bacterium]
MSYDCHQKTVLITGASNGIGRACVEMFAAAGARIILCARNKERLEQLQQQLENTETYLMVLDISDKEAVAKAFAALPDHWCDIDILINNAGLALGLDKVQDVRLEDLDTMIDVNVKGLLYVTQYVMQNMLKRNHGHIVNLGSISGYQVYSGGSVYCATKFAVRALSDGIKMDVHGSKIRVTEIDPGLVKTNFSNVRFAGDTKRAEAVYESASPLMAEDIADAVLYCVTRPEHVDVRVMHIYPTAQTAAHLFHREE